MSTSINRLRRVIRRMILEGEERVYDDTVLPGEEADDELLAEPDLTDQEERDEYIADKQSKRAEKRQARHQSKEQDESMGDENTIAGGGIAGHVGGGWGPPQPSKPMKSRNAMGGKKKKRSLDEYDE